MTHKKAKGTLVILDQASGYLQVDMIEAYLKAYSSCAIVAGSIVVRGTPLPDNVKWHKIKEYDRSTTFKRIYTWIIGSLGMFWVVLTKYRKSHIVAITNPPFSIYIPWLLGCSYDILVYDMYPDALVQYGYTKKNSWIFKFWSLLNKKACKNAQQVFTLTKGMKRLVETYMPKNKPVKVVPLWSAASDFKSIPRPDNEILKQTASVNKFNIVYSGNIGMTHPVEKLIELAEYLNPKLFSVIIIGGGAKKKLLENMQASKQLENVHLLPWQPIELLSHNLYAADLNVVTLDKEASDLSIPSKTFNILSIGNPILGICDMTSGLADLIEDYKCGLISDGVDLKELAQKIVNLQKQPERLKELKNNSLKASLNYTKANAEMFLEA